MSAAPEISFDLSGLGLTVRGLPAAHASRLLAEWGDFSSPRAGGFLEIVVHAEPEADDATVFSPKTMAARFGGGTAHYRMPEGAAEVPLAGAASVRLERTTAAKQYFAFLNLACASVAWRLPSRGGAAIHAAGIVLDGRAFLAVGAEGSGKSSFARLAREGGALVLSDDLVLVDRAAGGGFEALGSPFRTHPHGSPGPGRWPVAAVLLPEKAGEPEIAPAPALLVRARLTANLPFVVDAAGSDPRSHAVVDALASSVPSRVLRFALEPSFVELLRRPV